MNSMKKSVNEVQSKLNAAVNEGTKAIQEGVDVGVRSAKKLGKDVEYDITKSRSLKDVDAGLKHGAKLLHKGVSIGTKSARKLSVEVEGGAKRHAWELSRHADKIARKAKRHIRHLATA